MSVVFLFSLFVSVSVFFFCYLVIFAVFRRLSTVSRVFRFVVFFFTSLWFIISYMVIQTLFCCRAAHFHCHTCEKTTHTTYITLHDDPVAYMYYIIHVLRTIFRVIHSNILHQCHHQIQWIAKMCTHRFCNFDLRCFFSHFSLDFLFLSFALFAHFANVGTNHTYILSTHNHVWCMYCTLYKHFYRFSFWATAGGGGEGERWERKGAVVKHS